MGSEQPPHKNATNKPKPPSQSNTLTFSDPRPAQNTRKRGTAGGAKSAGGGGNRSAGGGNRSAGGGNRSTGGGKSAGGSAKHAAGGNRSAGGGGKSTGGGNRSAGGGNKDTRGGYKSGAYSGKSGGGKNSGGDRKGAQFSSRASGNGKQRPGEGRNNQSDGKKYGAINNYAPPKQKRSLLEKQENFNKKKKQAAQYRGENKFSSNRASNYTIRDQGSVRLKSDTDEDYSGPADRKWFEERDDAQNTGDRRGRYARNRVGRGHASGERQDGDRARRQNGDYQHGDTNDRLPTDKDIAHKSPAPKTIDIMEVVSVSDLAKKMNIKSADLLQKLMSMGIMASINERIDSDTATLIAEEYGCSVNIISLYDETQISTDTDGDAPPLSRPAVVTVMGHVDHGKTTLLDTIRNTNVVAGESGGITQHIAAYQIDFKGEKITFIDTPGHAAFTLMRARGAKVTDIVVLVVSADDGLKPQTQEAIDHARAAKVPLIVAINKIDLESSNVEQTKTQLSTAGLVPEEWGGDTIICPISALKGEGIPDLIDAILVQAHELNLVAPQKKSAIGRILEARIDHGRGIVCTVLVQEGVLHSGDSFLAGIFSGRVRAMFNDHGVKLATAPPSTPVEVLGFTEIPNAGDPFEVTSSEKEAKIISSKRQELKKIEQAKEVKKIGVEEVYSVIEKRQMKVCKVIVKGDVTGSVEAVKTSLERLEDDEVNIEVIHAAAGDINESDVLLASASNALIIGFHTRPSSRIQQLADQEGVEIKKYAVIYHVLEDIEKHITDMRKPEYKEVNIGECEVRETFGQSSDGLIIGIYVAKGKVTTQSIVDIYRGQDKIARTKALSLRRFQNNVKEVEAGYECGMVIEKTHAAHKGDRLLMYEVQSSHAST